MVQDVERFGTELNPELLRNARRLPVFRKRAVDVPQIWADDCIPAGIAICSERRGHETVRVEPDSVELPVACVEIATRLGIGTRGIGAETIVDTVCDRDGSTAPSSVDTMNEI